ncbi:MAG TPA: FixH family protein [Polyangia bacterium]|nr:FixH family protein [Polyangia bacterium]
MIGALLLIGCGGSEASPQIAPLTFSGPASETVTAADGAVTIAVRWSWSPPVVGYDAGELTLTDANGAPMSGYTLSVVPWMPAHGHGASVAPTVNETSPGVYVAAPLDFYMSGNWQLLTTITGPADAAAAFHDSAQPSVDIP